MSVYIWSLPLQLVTRMMNRGCSSSACASGKEPRGRGVETSWLSNRPSTTKKPRWQRERLGAYISLGCVGRLPEPALTLFCLHPSVHIIKLISTAGTGTDSYTPLRLCRWAYEPLNLTWSPSRILAGVFYTTTRLRAAPEKLQRMKYDWAIRKVRRRGRPTSPVLLLDIELISQTRARIPQPSQHVLFTEGKVR